MKSTTMDISFWMVFLQMFFLLFYAQGQIISPEVNITSMKIESKIVSRLARVLVKTQMENNANTSLETQFSFQLPDTAFVSNFTMTIGNKFIQGEVKEKKKAEEIYEESKKIGASAAKINRENTDPHRDMKIFTVTVNVARKSKASFQLQYQELLVRKLGSYTQRISIQPKQIVPDLVFQAKIYEQEGISVFSYSLPNSNITETSSSDVSILEASDLSRKLVFNPTIDYQTRSDPTNGISGEIVLKYDVYHKNKGGLILQQNNFFVHFLAPSGFSVLDKNIVFVIDVSGSMRGLKIEQTRQAMISILDLLNSGDFFNILLFNGDTNEWFSEPLPATRGNIEKAKQFVVKQVRANGGTGINKALLEAIGLLEATQSLGGTRGNIIVFLTDGLPTVGETNTKTIRRAVREKNKHRFSLFSLGFGFDVDMPFLKALSWENGGFAKRIYAENDASEQLQNFYHELKDPTLIDVNIAFHENEIVVDSLTKTSFQTYFKGSELVIAGQLNDNYSSPWTASVRGSGSGDNLDEIVSPTSVRVHDDSDLAIIEKIWAYMKINDMLKDLAITDDQDRRAALSNLTLKLSLEYNFVTPLTSMVVSELMPSFKEKMSDDVLESRSSYQFTHYRQNARVSKEKNRLIPQGDTSLHNHVGLSKSPVTTNNIGNIKEPITLTFLMFLYVILFCTFDHIW